MQQYHLLLKHRLNQNSCLLKLQKRRVSQNCCQLKLQKRRVSQNCCLFKLQKRRPNPKHRVKQAETPPQQQPPDLLQAQQLPPDSGQNIQAGDAESDHHSWRRQTWRRQKAEEPQLVKADQKAADQTDLRDQQETNSQITITTQKKTAPPSQ